MKPNLIEMQIQRHQISARQNSGKARKCPVCPDTDLVATDRGDVEIDVCPKCRGVWLDRGELDKIIERATTNPPEPRAGKAQPGGGDGHEEPAAESKKRAGRLGRRRYWLLEIFDYYRRQLSQRYEHHYVLPRAQSARLLERAG